MICTSLHKNHLRGHVFKHMRGYCTWLHRRIQWNIAASMSKSSEQNQPTKIFDLYELISHCTVCLAYLRLFSTIIIFNILNNKKPSTCMDSQSHQDGKQVIYNWWPYCHVLQVKRDNSLQVWLLWWTLASPTIWDQQWNIPSCLLDLLLA